MELRKRKLIPALSYMRQGTWEMGEFSVSQSVWSKIALRDRRPPPLHSVFYWLWASDETT